MCILQGWEEACRFGNARDYCWQSFLSHNTLEVHCTHVHVHVLYDVYVLYVASFFVFNSPHRHTCCCVQLLKNMKRQFCGLLFDTGFIHSSNPDNDEANYNSGNTKLLKAVLCAGLYPNVAKIVQNRLDRLV